MSLPGTDPSDSDYDMNSVFAYRAATAGGEICAGKVDAASSSEAREILTARGMYVLSLESHGRQLERRDPLSVADLALGLRVLADLLESGLSVSRALHAFDELAPRGWRPALPHIRQSVREGHSLASALASAPVVIPGLVIGVTQAGEVGGGIGPAIRRAAELMESSAEMRASIRAALAYPAVVVGAGVLAIGVLVTVVLPRFAKILADLGQTLPASTRAVLAGAAIAHAALIPGVVCIGIAFALWRSWTHTEQGRRTWHRLLLSVPVLGPVRAGAAAARMAYSLSAMLQSGVTIAAALVYAARATADAELEARLAATRVNVTSGEPLSRSLEMNRATTLTVVRLVRAGEESGRLPAMLDHAARIEQQRADRVVRTAVRLLEPMLLLTFASVVALIAAALLQAIYSVRPTA
jgi:type II secretory pathway component PulF